jgi:ankyrin repeat protein
MSALPSSPDLSFDRKQAKALLRDCRAGNPDAIARVFAAMPRIDTAVPLTLADAQHVIARERGFDSWPKLKAAVEAAQPFEQQVQRFLAAVREHKLGPAQRILDAHPTVASASIFAAAAAGRFDLVADFIAKNADAAFARDGREESTPLAYACGSPFHRTDGRHAEDLRRIVTLLLDRGVSANSSTAFYEGDKKMPIPVLYYAVMSDHVALVELLLARGASPNDGESVYHAAQHNRVACLERLLAHGANLSSKQSPYDNTPLFFLVGHHTDEGGEAAWFKGMVWLLDHGADPNVTAYKKGEAPLHSLAASAPKPATVRALLAHGADPNQRRNDGRTPYRIALRHGNVEIAEILRAHGATTDGVAPIEEFLGACLAADGDRARAVLVEHPDLMASLTDEDRWAVCDAVLHDRADAVRLMVSLGFSLTWTRDGGTPLHWAAWNGKADLVKVLLELGAPVNQRDTQFGSSALGWTAHGSGCWHGRDAAYCAIVDELITAGADRPSSINSGGEPPEGMASRVVSKHLREIGFAPATTATSQSSES